MHGRWVHFVNDLAARVGPGPAVMLIGLTAGALCFALGLGVIAFRVTFRR